MTFNKKSKDVLDSLERRLDPRWFEESQWIGLPKLTYEDKKTICKAIHSQIKNKQLKLDDMRANGLTNTSEFNSVKLSQMILFFIYDKLICDLL